MSSSSRLTTLINDKRFFSEYAFLAWIYNDVQQAIKFDVWIHCCGEKNGDKKNCGKKIARDFDDVQICFQEISKSKLKSFCKKNRFLLRIFFQ